MDREIASETRRSAERDPLHRRPSLSARSPSVAAARHLAEGSAVGLLLLAGARAAAWAVPPLSVIVAVVT
jgi:hypothetical protein